MTTKDNALRMAIEAMETHVPYYVLEKGYAPLIACKAALSEPVTLHDGWVAVPGEPTEEMIEAGSYTLLTGAQDRPELSWADESKLAYKAMLQAAPTCEKEKG
jgi:hypothetical protein